MKNMVPLPEYGDKMTLAEWKEALTNGWFNEYDGSGYYATATKMDYNSNCFDNPPEWATHVMWFNK